MKRITARVFIVLFFLSSMLLTSCGSQPASEPTKAPEQTQMPEESKAPEESQDTGSQEIVYKQSPFLDGRDLPPIEERLPKEPKLTNEVPLDMLKDGKYEIGRFGGVMRMPSPSPDWNAEVFLMLNEPLLNTPGVLGQEVTPNILKNFEISSDNKVFTFYMREGLKWSDGQPVTSEDVAFAVEDVIMNEKLTPAFPTWLRSGNKNDGEPMKFEVIDEYTFRISFAEPYGRFPIQLALTGWRGYTDLLKPKHYLKDFHEKYADKDALAAKVKEAGYQDGEWWNLFNEKDVTNWELTSSQALGFPNLYPWIMVKSTETIKEYERNPYYFKIDAEGNQLPYIDTIQTELVQDDEMANSKVIAGEVDFMSERSSLNKVSIYKENAEKNGYEVVLLDSGNPTCIWLNLTYDDPVWRQVTKDVRFRKALNMAINRQEIIDSIYYGFGNLPEMVPSEYNPEEAKKLLDEMGLDKKDSNGFRLGPDGKVFEIHFEVAAHAPDIVPVTELVVQMWNEIGIKTSMKTIDATLWSTRNNANELQATNIWNIESSWRTGGWLDFMPSNEGKLWEVWNNTKGQEGEEPPEDVKRLYELGGLIMTVYPGTPEDQQYFDEIYKIHYEGIYQMVIAEDVKCPVIVRKGMGNVPIKGDKHAATISGEQMFYRE